MPRVRTILGLAGAIGTSILVVIGTAGPLLSRVEQPLYKIERAVGSIEVRAYPPMVVAEVTVQGDRQAAIRQGFQIIAGYIFGGNVGSQKVAMTAPVMQEQILQRGATGQMIKPELITSWKVRFVMPRQWPLDRLPKPADQRVVLANRPAATFAAIRFAGLGRSVTIADNMRELRAFLANNKLEPVGAPILAFFNPPWTLPFLRRNEIMIEVKP